MCRPVWIVAILAAAAVTAVFPPAAAAKGALELCGASGCAVLSQGEQALPFFAPETAARIPPAAPAPFYEIRFADVPGTFAYWVPSAHALRFSNGGVAWTPTTAGQDAALLRAAQGLAPHAAPTKVWATVDNRSVRNPRGWLALYTIGKPAVGAPGGVLWLTVFVDGPRTTPWTDGADTIDISRSAPILLRDGQYVRIPAALARKIRARQPLA